MWRLRQLGAAGWMLGGLLALFAACGSGEARAPNPTRPVDEHRALELIVRAVRSEGADPVPGRDEPILGSDKVIHVDVGVRNKRYGIAFITPDKADSLGDALPPPNRKDEKLKLKRAGEDGGAHVLLLYQQNYLYDDLSGDAHEQTTITAESTLTRDVRDFMVHARARAFE